MGERLPSWLLRFWTPNRQGSRGLFAIRAAAQCRRIQTCSVGFCSSLNGQLLCEAGFLHGAAANAPSESSASSPEGAYETAVQPQKGTAGLSQLRSQISPSSVFVSIAAKRR